MGCPEARQSKIYYPQPDKARAKITIQWPKLKLGRYIRAVTGHNNLLYHLHNMHHEISPLCRFCLDHNEEFNHLATDCPPLWWERHHISALSQDQEWNPHQIAAFAFLPRIDEAFAKPLYVIPNVTQAALAIEDSQNPDDPTPNFDDSGDNEESVMDVSSLSDSSSEGDVSIISVDTDYE